MAELAEARGSSDWLVAYCEPRRELLARDSLRNMLYEAFCPHELVKRRRPFPGRRGKWRLVDEPEPLFRGYCFVKACDDVYFVSQACGVLDVVRAGRVPLRVPEAVVRPYRERADENDVVSVKDVTLPSLSFRGRVGDQVRLSRGPFADFVARLSDLSQLDATGKVRAWVTLLGAEHELTFDSREVGPVVKRALAA